MTDILDLKGWTVLGRTEEDGADVLEAEYPLPMPTACPKCGTLDCIYRHGTKATTYVDIPMRGKHLAAKAGFGQHSGQPGSETHPAS
jgi:transposase